VINLPREIEGEELKPDLSHHPRESLDP
jgi:hypothetical protein